MEPAVARICRLIDRTGIGYTVDETGSVLLEKGRALLFVEGARYVLVVRGEGEQPQRSSFPDTASAFEAIRSWRQAKLIA